MVKTSIPCELKEEEKFYRELHGGSTKKNILVFFHA